MASSPKKAAHSAVVHEQPESHLPEITAAAPEPEQAAVIPAAEAPAAEVQATETPATFIPAAEVETVKAIEVETVKAIEVETVKAIEAQVAVAKDLGENVRSIVAKGFNENVRTLVEKGLVDARARYSQAKVAAEEASAAVEASYGAARDGVVAFNLKAIDAIKADADANFDLLRSLATAKSASELVTLQTEFARKRFEAATARSKELAEFARKVADEAAAPIKAQVAKTFKIQG
jgi:phasin